MISIVIPVYNAEKTIGQAIDSVLAQTYADFEVICVDDVSKDASVEIIKGYQLKDSRVVLVRNEENLNAGGTRNAGLKNARGEYVIFLDNDDWLAPNALQVLVDSSDNGAADIVAPDWWFYPSENAKVYKDNLLYDASAEDNRIHILKNGVRILGCLFRKKMIEENKIYFPEKIFYEDNAVGSLFFMVAQNIRVVKKALYYYRISTTSVTGFSSMKKLTDRIKTTEMFLDNMKQFGFYSEKYKEWIDQRYLTLSCNTLGMLAKMPFDRDVYNCLKHVVKSNRQLKPYRNMKDYDKVNRLFLKLPYMCFLMKHMKYHA